MLGVSTVCNSYECFDTSSRTVDGLNRLGEFIGMFREEFVADIHRGAFEDHVDSLSSESYDFAITSPPYFDTELYSTEADSSSVRYKTFNDWADGFFRPMVRGVMRILRRPHGVFVLNIGSRVYPLNDILRQVAEVDGLKMQRLGNLLSGTGGLGKSGEGEMFYALSAQ